MNNKRVNNSNRSPAEFYVVGIDPVTDEWIYEDPDEKRYVDGDTVETWSVENLRARELFHLLLDETLTQKHRELLRGEHYRRWDFESDHCPSQHNNDGDDICEDCGEDLQWAGDEQVSQDRAEALRNEIARLHANIIEIDKGLEVFAKRARAYLESVRPEESIELAHVRKESKEYKDLFLLERRYHLSEKERARRLAKEHMRYREQIDEALGVTPEERQAETGAGFDGALKLLLKRYEALRNCALDLDILVGPSSRFELQCDENDPGEGYCVFCDARRQVAAVRKLGLLPGAEPEKGEPK